MPWFLSLPINVSSLILSRLSHMKLNKQLFIFFIKSSSGKGSIEATQISLDIAKDMFYQRFSIFQNDFFTHVFHKIIHTLRLFKTFKSIMKINANKFIFCEIFLVIQYIPESFHIGGPAKVHLQKSFTFFSAYISTLNVVPNYSSLKIASSMISFNQTLNHNFNYNTYNTCSKNAVSTTCLFCVFPE